LNAAQAALWNWKDGKLISKEDFVKHGKACVKPGFDYFFDKFIDPDGPFNQMMHAFHAATLFNPIKMKDKLDAEVEDLIDQLSSFKYEEFSLIIPQYHAAINLPFDWLEC
jgi:hypothetical protein